MSTSRVLLAALMWLVTYPSRAVPLLAPGIDRLPAPILTYLRLVGPAVLFSLAAVNVLLVPGPGGRPHLHLGAATIGVVICVAVVSWRRNVFLGLVAAVAVVVGARAAGIG